MAVVVVEHDWFLWTQKGQRQKQKQACRDRIQQGGLWPYTQLSWLDPCYHNPKTEHCLESYLSTELGASPEHYKMLKKVIKNLFLM